VIIPIPIPRYKPVNKVLSSERGFAREYLRKERKSTIEVTTKGINVKSFGKLMGSSKNNEKTRMPAGMASIEYLKVGFGFSTLGV